MLSSYPSIGGPRVVRPGAEASVGIGHGAARGRPSRVHSGRSTAKPSVLPSITIPAMVKVGTAPTAEIRMAPTAIAGGPETKLRTPSIAN